MTVDANGTGSAGESSAPVAESGGESFMSQMAGEVAGQGSEGGSGDSGSTLMSRMADEGGGAASAEGNQAEGEKADPALALVPEGPDGYGLSFGEETEVDAELLSGFTATAHELGLNKGQAQKLAAMYEKHMTAAEQKYQAEQAAALMKAKEAWVAEIKSRPTYQAEENQVKRALAAFGSRELFDLMNQTHLGDHPVFWDFMARAGKALGEPGFHGKPAGGGKEPALMDRMWSD